MITLPTRMILWKNKKKTCSTVSQVPNPVQWQFTTNTAAPSPVNSITTTDQACSPSIKSSKTTVNKTASSDVHGNTVYMPCHNKRQDTIPHSTLQRNDGHIHRASPIRSLPPEPSFQKTTMVSQQQILDATNSPQMTVQPHNRSHLPTNPTACNKARKDRTGFSQGKMTDQSRYRYRGPLPGQLDASLTESDQKLGNINPSVVIFLTDDPLHQEQNHTKELTKQAPTN